jgi:hypothetical protein
MKKDFVSQIVNKNAKAATEQLREHLQDVVGEITKDQQKWLDDMMRDLLPPNLYEAGKRGDMIREVGEYIRKHNIRILFVPDSLVIRIMIGDKMHSQFIPKLMLDGEELRATVEASPNINN